MERRTALVALVLAIPLLAFPVVSPPPDPPDQAYIVEQITEDTPEPPAGTPTVAYSNLSERAQSIFDETAPDGRTFVRESDPVARFGTEDTTIVEDGEDRFIVGAQVQPREPSLQSVVIRFASVFLGVVLLAVGGYGWLTAEPN